MKPQERILWVAIDTAGAVGGVALGSVAGEGELELAGFFEVAGKTFSGRLLPQIRELLDGAGRTLADVGALAVATGPGSFTGLRVGISAAKGLAEVTGRPVVGVSRLALLCAAGLRDAGMGAGDGEQTAILDAGRGEFYVGRYRERGMGCERETVCGRGELLELVEGIAAPPLVCEEAVEAALDGIRVTRVEAPTAADALRLAVRYWRAGRSSDVSTLDANYLRRSDAELFARGRPAGSGH